MKNSLILFLFVVGLLVLLGTSLILEGPMLVYGQQTTGTATITASKNNDTQVEPGTGIKNSLLRGLAQLSITKLDIFENGSAVATFTGDNTSGVKVLYNHTVLPENGYTWADNGTIFTPEGRRLETVLN